MDVLRRLRRAFDALRHDPAPWCQSPVHQPPRHGAVYLDYATGQRSKYDARRGVWITQPIDVPDNGVA